MSTPRLPDPIGPVPAEPGTLDAVLATARQRRLRRMQVLGGTGVAALLATALAVSLGGGDGSQTIGVTSGDGSSIARDHSASPDPEPTDQPGACPTDGDTTECTRDEPSSSAGPPTPSPAPTTSHSGSGASETPTPYPTPYPTKPTPYPTKPTPYPTRSQQGGLTPSPYPKPSEYPSRTPQPAPSGEPSQAARGEMRRTHDSSAAGGMFCEPGSTWCSDAQVSGTGPVEFAIRVCRDERAGPGSLSISAAPADFAVEQGGRELWRWSSGQAFPAYQQTLEFGAGDCYQWATTWRGVDDHNRNLPAGRYAVRSTFRSEEIQPSYRSEFDLS